VVALSLADDIEGVVTVPEKFGADTVRAVAALRARDTRRRSGRLRWRRPPRRMRRPGPAGHGR
jgi:hypothetical protein